MHRRNFITLAATVALMVTPAVALAVGPPAGVPTPANHPSATNHPTGTDNPGIAKKTATPGPNANAGVKAKAYGTYCKDQSKKHVAGQSGTPFSKCVTAMARVANASKPNPT